MNPCVHPDWYRDPVFWLLVGPPLTVLLWSLAADVIRTIKAARK